MSSGKENKLFNNKKKIFKGYEGTAYNKGMNTSLGEDLDPMFEDATKLIVGYQQCSVSILQRKLKLGYSRAERILDQLQEAGIVGPEDGRKNRAVLVKNEKELTFLGSNVQSERVHVVRVLAYVYQSFIYVSRIQEETSDSEVDQIISTMNEKIREWIPDISQEELSSVMIEVGEKLSRKDPMEVWTLAVDLVGKLNLFDENNNISILQDLIDIALIDGNINESELKLINTLVKVFQLSHKVDVNEYAKEIVKYKIQDYKNESSKNERINFSEWSIIHDILTLLIYIGKESESNLTNLEWDIITSSIVKFKIVIYNKEYSISDYKMKELEELINFVIDTMNSDKNDPQMPTNYYNQSVKNITDYYKSGELEAANIHAIIKLMFNVSIADGFITDGQEYILDHIIKYFIGNVPSLEVIGDLIKVQIMSQELKRDIIMKEPNILDPGGIKLDPKTGEMDFELPTFKDTNSVEDLPDEIIAEVYKNGSNYRAKIKETEDDITELINNPTKLKYAFERSGLVRGKKDKDGNYKWRVMG